MKQTLYDVYFVDYGNKESNLNNEYIQNLSNILDWFTENNKQLLSTQQTNIDQLRTIIKLPSQTMLCTLDVDYHTSHNDDILFELLSQAIELDLIIKNVDKQYCLQLNSNESVNNNNNSKLFIIIIIKT